MARGFREEVDDNDAGDDQRQAGDRRRIEALPEKEPADHSDQSDADSGPDRVGDADRYRVKPSEDLSADVAATSQPMAIAR